MTGPTHAGETGVWRTYKGVGPRRAHALRKVFDTPADFIAECERRHPEVPTYSALELMLLTEAEGVGHGIASSIVDQMAEELSPIPYHER